MGSKEYIEPLACLSETMHSNRIVSAAVQIGMAASRLIILSAIETQTDDEKAEEKALNKYIKLMRKLDKRIDRGQ